MDLSIKNLIGSLLDHQPKTSLSQTATIETSILRRTDRVPRQSGRAEAVIKRNRPDAHSIACLVHPSGVEYVQAHGSSDKDSKDTIQKTALYYLQTQIQFGFKNHLTTHVLESGDTLANLVRTVADEVMEQGDTARLGQLNTNVRAQLAIWARGTTFPPQSMTKLVPCDHLPALPASVPNYTHRFLVGALAFSTSSHTDTPTPVITPIFRGILQDWVLIVNDKNTTDLVPHRITLHLTERFMEMVCLFEMTARVPTHPTAKWIFIDRLAAMRTRTAEPYVCCFCLARVEILFPFKTNRDNIVLRCEQCEASDQTSPVLVSHACVDGHTELLRYCSNSQHQVIQAQAVKDSSILVGSNGLPVLVTAAVCSVYSTTLLWLTPTLCISANHQISSG